MVDLDVEVDGTISVDEGHKLATQVERYVCRALKCVYDIVVHIEPYGHEDHHETFGMTEEMLNKNNAS
ncbi:MAG TPA: hypothetical protein ENN77_01155 [Candidatus Wirthbacteria bacterium]|nr:hypothetical protein [Candidatus Wirthbacteria bacterium]